MALPEELKKSGDWLFRNRSFLPLAALFFAILVYIEKLFIQQEIASVRYFLPEEFDFFCLSVSLLGLLIRIYTVGYTPKDTSGRNTFGQLAERLNTTGLYSIVRHPLYLGNFFMWMGIALMTQNCWFIISFSLAYWIYYERIMYAEEYS
ncbi:MAG: methyltransferase family protein [Bacteroidia bacterium]